MPGRTPVMPLLVSWSSDSAGVTYRARCPSDGVAGYHRETMSSRAFPPSAQGSGRETSVSHKDVVPTGPGPVGSGSDGVCPHASPASAELPMPPTIRSQAHRWLLDQNRGVDLSDLAGPERRSPA